LPVAKFLAVVVVCGIYDGHNRVCLEWTDQAWFASRAQCIERGKEIAKKVTSLGYYASLKLEKSPVPSCRVIGDKPQPHPAPPAPPVIEQHPEPAPPPPTSSWWRW